MSAPFDPTKFNLDPNTPEPKKQITKPEVKNPEVKQDVLGSIAKPVAASPEVKKSSIAPAIPIKNDILGEIDSSLVKEDTKNNQEKSVNSVAPVIKKVLPTNTTEPQKQPEKKQNIIDINITSLEDIIIQIAEKDYEYILIEPEDTQVKLTFRQDNIDKEIKYIKFPVYTSILFKIKQITGLTVDDNQNSQEGKGSIKVGTNTFKLSSKTVPGQNGERVWLKSKEDTTKKGKKAVKKTPISAIFGFLGAILFVSLVLGSAFIAFIVMNANDVQDVQFFIDLGININDVNLFISKVVNIIFSILLFISSVALAFGLFKFFLTKKIYKRKKIVYGVVSTLLLIITFSIGLSWMAIDERIKNLPNWQERIYGNLKIFDNDLLISEDFQESQAILTETQDLIGPVTLKLDLENYQNSQAQKGIQVNKYIWSFGSETIETFSPNIIKTFKDKGNYEILVSTVGSDINGEEVEQEISNIPTVSISHIVEIVEETTNNGGKELKLDASDLENLGKIKWYFKTPITDSNPTPPYPEWTNEQGAEGYTFFPRKIFFEDVFIGVSIINSSTLDETIDKVFVVSAEKSSEISGNIEFVQSLEEELNFMFNVTSPSTGFANGFIDTFKWEIEDKTYSSDAETGNSETSPSIEHTFSSFGEQEISVTLTDSTGNSEKITRTITIQKKVTLREGLLITDDNGNEIETMRYEEASNEYFLDDIGIPTNITLDTRYVKPVNSLYTLIDIDWDIGNDGDIDANGTTFEFDIPTEGNHVVTANYSFQHRRDAEDIINLTEFIFVQGIKKEAILNLDLEYNTDYAPVVVRFDASKSFIKDDDIVKFIYDYGDGVIEERDAINPGHRYSTNGDYTIKLTVVGKTGKEYSLEKKLILLPPAQEISISSSLKKAPILQGIDFSSADSAGQIVEYFWDFGDGNISTSANPSHSYKKSGIYEVTLRADFVNSNIKEDTIEVEIYEE